MMYVNMAGGGHLAFVQRARVAYICIFSCEGNFKSFETCSAMGPKKVQNSKFLLKETKRLELEQ